MSQQIQTSDEGSAAARVLALLEEALEVLDSSDAPAEIGAHVDLAACRLRDFVEQNGSGEAKRQ